MTYYGRWSYKYEIAAEKGAAAAIIVHETIPAAYPWSVVENSNAKENFVIDTPDKNMKTLARPFLDHARRREETLRRGRKDFEEMKKEALSKNFKPVSLGGEGGFLPAKQDSQIQIAQRRRQARRRRSGRGRTNTSSTARIGIISGATPI